ncbi:MAG: GNAT family N-acetyltransferase [Sphingomonadales bacterium]|nr:MAG: GNAT family N-acetyltransferase [Sphingomonadales bacterium]
MNIRVATRDDLPRIHPVIERAYRGEPARLGWSNEADLVDGARTDIETLTAIVEDPASRLLLAEDGGEVLGCVHIADLGGGAAYLGLLSVEPTLQTGGIGKRLLEAADRVARDVFEAKRIEMTVIDSREELIAYYRRRGFVPTGELRDFPIPRDPPLFMTVLVKPLL